MSAVRTQRGPLRVVVHDYGGFPFVVELARELAARGNEVLHLHAAGFRKPKGPVERLATDPPSLLLEPITLAEPLHRGGMRRIPQERRYGRLLADRIGAYRPDVVISANSPLDVEAAAQAGAHAVGAASVFWLQDLYSVAISRIIGRRLRLAGTLVGARFRRLERSILRGAEAVVPISPAFAPTLSAWGIPSDNVTVIENWAPLTGDAPPPRLNAWSQHHGLADRQVIMYAGTLALKHNPRLLLSLAEGLPTAMVVVVSEGPGASWLTQNGRGQANLRVLPFQPYDQVDLMLASSDLLVAVLEPDASSFSAPSKILTYLAAARPILAAMPDDNPAAMAVRRAQAGRVVGPEPGPLLEAAREMLSDAGELQRTGASGHAHARRAFQIASIADRFEQVLQWAVDRKSGSVRRRRGDTVPSSDPSNGATS